MPNPASNDIAWGERRLVNPEDLDSLVSLDNPATSEDMSDRNSGVEITEDQVSDLQVMKEQIKWLCHHVELALIIASFNPMFNRVMAKAMEKQADMHKGNS